MCKIYQILTVAFFVSGSLAAKLPENIKRCSQKDGDIGKCLKVNVRDALIKMKDGIPNLGIAPLEPLHINGFEIGAGEGPVNLKQSFNDLELGGVTDCEFTKYEANLDDFKLYTEANNPILQLTGDYEMNGHVLVLPVQGKGKCNITMINVKTTHTITGEAFEKKGKKYIKVTDYKFTLDPERVYMQFGNLFNGDPLLGETTGNFLNEQWKEVFGELKPGYEETFGIIFQDIANRIFTRVPFNDIFLE